MTRTRIAAGLLSLLLTALLSWTVIGGVADLRTQIMLGFGALLGAVTAIFGRLPGWLIIHSSGSLTADDDPSNISARLYLPIIGLVILLTAIVFGIGMFLQ